MDKIYNYDNCKVILQIPEDEHFKNRLKKASSEFMAKVLVERDKIYGDSNTSRNLIKK